jgi:hypothetical protein
MMGFLSLYLIAITFLQVTVAAPAVAATRSPGNSLVVLALFSHVLLTLWTI